MPAATDDFAQYRYAGVGFSSPAYHAAVVTPNDNNDLSDVTRWVFIGGAGALAVITAGGETLTISGLTAGTLLPLRVSRIQATGTTATNIVALW